MRKLQTASETEIIFPNGNVAFDAAHNKAVHGHRSWLVYERTDGCFVIRLYNAAAIKAAMLSVGTRGRFYWVSANDGTGHICRSWSYALHLLRCARGWERHGYAA